MTADKILTESPYKKMRADRYATFSNGAGADFATGKLSLEELAAIGSQNGEPTQLSGKQELYEALINQYV